jgi:retron-type reverse transcriptase
MVAIHVTGCGKNARRPWVLDADLKAAFDKIDHSFLLSQLGSFPSRDLIAGWLKAGVLEAGKGFALTEEGTPQGGVSSLRYDSLTRPTSACCKACSAIRPHFLAQRDRAVRVEQ